MRIKRAAWGELLPPLSNLFLHLLSFLLLFAGKVNLFIPSQQGGSDTPIQPHSLSTHPCQGEWSLGRERETHTHTRTHTHTHAHMHMHRHTHTHTHTRTHPSLKGRAHCLPRCSKGQFSSAGPQLACSNINYIYHVLMRPLKGV